MKKAYITDKTAFVVGNGPSLSSFNLEGLNSHTWVGMNAAYRHWERIGIYPTHYACLDEVVGLSHADSICQLVQNAELHGIKAFLLRKNLIRSRDFLDSHSRVFCYEEVFSDIPERVRDLVTTGSHAALWLAFLGYKQIILLGIDANYVETVETAKAHKGSQLKIVRSGTNPNYYFDDYQKTGDKFLTPNPVPGVHTGAWNRVSQYLAHTLPDTTLLNGSPVSQVDCTDFIDIQAFLKTGSEITSPKVVFSHPQHQKFRQAHLEHVDPSEFSIAKFIDQISHSKYHQYLGDAQQINSLSKLGWTQVTESKLESRWGLISYNQQNFLTSRKNITKKSSIVLVHSDGLNEMRPVIVKLQRDFDTVLQITISQKDIRITPSSSGLNLATCIVVAFEHERFSQTDLQTALEAAMSKNYRGNFKYRRRIFYRLWLLKNTIKSVLRS